MIYLSNYQVKIQKSCKVSCLLFLVTNYNSRSQIGIDVSKHHLDVAFPGVAKVWRTPNDASGISVRCCLYMATIVAIRCNPTIRPFYKRLREQDKPPKVAIVTAMRKLITVANSVLTYDRPWHANPA